MSEQTVRLHRVLRAPPGRVYRAFLDADALCRWLPPYGFLCRVHELDAQVGGHFRMSFRNFATGREPFFGGEYLELLPEQLIRYVDRFDDPEVIDGVRDTGGRVSLAIVRCTKPVIAAINGAAVGIGATMTLPMDVRIASEKARIGFVFGRLGIVPEACSTWFLPRIVGISRALELVYSADIISAADAHDIGLVRDVVPEDELLPAAYALARRFVDGRSPVATALMRQMMYRNSAQDDPVEAHRIESLAMFYASIGDGKEGVAAFLEKRPADFTARTSTDMPPFYPW